LFSFYLSLSVFECFLLLFLIPFLHYEILTLLQYKCKAFLWLQDDFFQYWYWSAKEREFYEYYCQKEWIGVDFG
jgi:hypothetical protein